MNRITSSETVIKALRNIGINSGDDFLNNLPYRYENNSYSDLTALENNQKIVIKGKLVSNPKRNFGKEVSYQFFFVSENNTFFNVIIFNKKVALMSLILGETYTVVGVYRNKTIFASSIFKGEIEEDKTIRTVYHHPNSITPTAYRNLVRRAYDKLSGKIIDIMPNIFKQKYRLVHKEEALKLVHFPEKEEDIVKGLRTLKYHECLTYTLKNQIMRGVHKKKIVTNKVLIDTKKINDFVRKLSYKLTSDQLQAIRDIILDMNQQSYMYRLVQGDVGTGKTIVSAIGLFGNFIRGNIGVFMVPTDALARQQYEELKALFKPYNINVGLLIGSQTPKQKNTVKMNLINHQIDVLVGTHALFSDDVQYPNLGLVVIDEQHRFGVEQRNKLLNKGGGSDLLLMSATPIPRTLALSVYGDLDITTLSEFPNKTRDVITKIETPDSANIISLIRECISNNRQVFIVAPKIENSNIGYTSAEELFEKYSILFEDNIQLLHGKLKSSEKEEVLKKYISGEKLILVSTTVIELGINVMNAGAIIIYSAALFGLASLHQLRGRVGRNGAPATCLLVDENKENERLKVLESSNDGFYISEQDLKMRGPGDAFGTSQSGFPTFSTLNIVNDFKMFECARDDAQYILKNLHISEFKKLYDSIRMSIIDEQITLFK